MSPDQFMREGHWMLPLEQGIGHAIREYGRRLAILMLAVFANAVLIAGFFIVVTVPLLALIAAIFALAYGVATLSRRIARRIARPQRRRPRPAYRQLRGPSPRALVAGALALVIVWVVIRRILD